jgi:LemA protein
MSTTGWVIIGIIVVLVLWVIMIYNGLVAMRQRVNQAFADIDVQLKQRHDLIPNLVETVKGYAAHERGTLEAVVQARNAAMAAPGVEQKVAAENMLSGALRQLFALSEAYPQLNENFRQQTTERHRNKTRGRTLQQRGRNSMPASRNSASAAGRLPAQNVSTWAIAAVSQTPGLA